MELFWKVCQFVLPVAVSGLALWLTYLKVRRDVVKDTKARKEEEKEESILGIHGLLEANKSFRDEIRKDYENTRLLLANKTKEADDAWRKFRECESHSARQDEEMKDLKFDFEAIKCEFAEFRKICQSKHQGPLAS